MSTTRSKAEQEERPVIFASLPTLKVIQPATGKHSTQNDQWCLTYCSQTVNGRIHNRAPWCRSVCIRKVFSHEVRNVLQFQSHREVDPDGKARYPLPQEGQPINLPRYLGGKPTDDPEHGRKSPADIKYWDEGWYLWKTNSFLGVYSSISMMPKTLEAQGLAQTQQKATRQLWKEYQDFLQSGQPRTQENKWLGPIVPPNFGPDPAPESLLVHLPLDSGPLLEPIYHLLAPAQHSLQLFHENFSAGNYEKFAQRIWNKTWTGEPFSLASRTCHFVYEQWKNKSKGPDEDDKEKEA